MRRPAQPASPARRPAAAAVRRVLPALPVLAVLIACSPPPPVDPSLATYIEGIRAIDNHAHPMLPVRPGAPADTDYDALPLDGIPPFPVPWRLRPDNPEWRAAGRALYSIPTSGAASDTGPGFADALATARAARLTTLGDSFPAWVLDQAGIDVMFANRIAMGPGLASPRFRWVAFDDALLFPLDAGAEAARTPDTRPLYPLEAKLLHRYLGQLGLTAVPSTLDTYVRFVIEPLLRRQRDAGAVAIKFEIAYLRPVEFVERDSTEAARIYARYAHGGGPRVEDDRVLEDWLFRAIARRAGALGLAVHIHMLDEFGGYYSANGAAPHLLETLALDPALRQTAFVLIHGGWPRVDETASLLGKPNFYADISMMTLLIEPRQLAGVLERWLAEWPEKVLFGTDAFGGGPAQDWDQGAYISSMTARRALGMALTEMMRDGEIDRARAEELARMVMRENAVKLYRLGT